MGKTKIEWASNADGTQGHTWNPTTGCTEVSPGCDHCYARTFAERFRGVAGSPYEQGFDLKLWPDRLQIPMRRRKPTTYFVNSMSDLFHKDVPDKFILEVFKVMATANQHTYQILTKRPSRLALLVPKINEVLGTRWPSHIWMGVSIENIDYSWRADKLREVPSAIRFISYEPALGPLDGLNLQGIHWLIAGAESGHGARPMDEDWVRYIRDRCGLAGVKFFYKQRLDAKGHKVSLPELDGHVWAEKPWDCNAVTRRIHEAMMNNGRQAQSLVGPYPEPNWHDLMKKVPFPMNIEATWDQEGKYE